MSLVDYGWAQPTVRSLCEARRRNIALCFSLDKSTRFYLLLCIRGWERRGSPDFEAFAADIAVKPRRAFLRKQWDIDLGSTNLLSRCSGRAWSRLNLDRLAKALGSPTLRAFLARQPTLSRKLVSFVVESGDEGFSVAHLDAFSRHGPAETQYVIQGLQRQNPLLAERDILGALKRISHEFDAGEFVHRLLIDVPLPPPIWSGTPHIWPLRTMRAIKQTGQLFGNCLVETEFGLWALAGTTTIYVGDIKGEPFCASVTRDRVFKGWRLTEVKGLRNRPLRGAVRRDILSVFEGAGFPYLPKFPLRGWID
jgi:hypothetical protein